MKENEEVYVQLYSHAYTFLFPLSCIKSVTTQEHLHLEKHHDGTLYMQEQPIRMYSFSMLLKEESEPEPICCLLCQEQETIVLRVAKVGDVVSYPYPMLPLPALVKTEDNAFLKGSHEQENTLGYVVDIKRFWQYATESVSL